MDAILTTAFLNKIIREESETFDKMQLAAMRRQLRFHSDEIIRARRFSFVSSGMSVSMNLTHTAFHRFLDIRRPGYKRRRIHNRYVWGAYEAIARRCMYDFTTEAVESIKKELNLKQLEQHG